VLILTDIDKGVGEITTAMKESEEYDYFFDSLGQLYSELAEQKCDKCKDGTYYPPDTFEQPETCYSCKGTGITNRQEEYLNKSSLAYEQYLKKFPVNHHVMEKLGIIYEKLGQEKKAKELKSKVKRMKI
jgi:hypothetical protein